MTQTGSRRDQILQALVRMLEAGPSERITTARLAREVGVSEAALYRHFPSKAKMFEGLIEFIEEALFTRVGQITATAESALDRCSQIAGLLLTFAERNPGMTRILTGEALAGETERLHDRVVQLFDRLETQLKQILREAELREGQRTTLPVPVVANLMLATIEGRIGQFARSGFRRPPTEHWNEQWQLLVEGMFMPLPDLRPGSSPHPPLAPRGGPL